MPSKTTSATTPYWGNYTSKSLPVTVDKSYVQATIEGCHHNTFMYRVKGTDGKFQDTNDSSVDVKIEHRSDFKGYPEGWRNELITGRMDLSGAPCRETPGGVLTIL